MRIWERIALVRNRFLSSDRPPTVSSYWERDIERSELTLLQRQEDTHRNKVCKFKLYYSSKFRVLRSTKISNTFLYNSKPLDVSNLGLPVIGWVKCLSSFEQRRYTNSFKRYTLWRFGCSGRQSFELTGTAFNIIQHSLRKLCQIENGRRTHSSASLCFFRMLWAS